MAAPHVTGICAKMKQWKPDFHSELMRAMLINTTIPVKANSSDALGAYANTQVGYGMANAFSPTTSYSGESQRILFVEGWVNEDDDPLYDDWPINVPAGSRKLVVTLAYNDQEGEESDDQALKDDLDLILISPSGQNYSAYLHTPADVETESPLEKMVITQPASGAWTVRVRFADSPGFGNPFIFGEQRYGVVAHAILKTPSLTLEVPSSTVEVAPGATFTVTPTVENTGGYLAIGTTVEVEAPSGFGGQVNVSRYVGNLMHQGASASPDFSVIAPAVVGTYNLTIGADGINKEFDTSGYPRTADIQVTVRQPCNLPAQASSPSPPNGQQNVSVDSDLDWANASGASSYDVYFGTDPTPDNGEYRGNTITSGLPLSTLSGATPHYWRIDTVNACGKTTGPVWSFTTACLLPDQASSPSPSVGAAQILACVDLDWNDAARATSYDVYFGKTSPPPFLQPVTASFVSLPNFDWDSTYYWRIDSKNSCGTTTGSLWTFQTVHPLSILAPDSNDSWQAGDNHSVSWSTTLSQGEITGELVLPEGERIQMARRVPVANGGFSWQVPLCVGNGDGFTVELDLTGVCGPDFSATSSPFVVEGGEPYPRLSITEPNAETVWEAGNIESISWDTTVPYGEIELELESSGEYGEITYEVLAYDGSTDYRVPTCIGNGSYRVHAYWFLACGSESFEIYAESDVFTIAGSDPRPTITLLEPHGGEVWEAGSTERITWSSTHPFGDVEIEFLDVDESVPMSSGFLDIEICPYVDDGAEYYVDISACDCGICVGDSSDGPVTIVDTLGAPAITLTSPTPGESLAAGSTQRISWMSSPSGPGGYVEIFGYKDFEGEPEELDIGYVPVSNGFFDWYISPFIGDGPMFLEVGWRPGCGDTGYDGDGPFEVVGSLPRPSITLVSPNGGESIAVGSTYAIAWEATHPTGEVCLSLRRGTSTVDGLGCVDMASEGFDWEVCPYDTGDDYRIRIRWCDGSVCVQDLSDAPFAIEDGPMPKTAITSPGSDTVWQAGTTQSIAWTSTSDEGYIELYLVSGSERHGITALPASEGQYEWRIWPYIGDASDYVISLVWSSDCGSPVEVLSEPFRIIGSLPVPTLTITSPNGGELLDAGASHLITWTADNAAGEVCLSLITAEDWVEHLGCVPMADGELPWLVCSYLDERTDYRVQMWWYDRPIVVEDESDLPFAIIDGEAPPTLTVVGPNGGEAWTIGTTEVISWNTSAVEGEVRAWLLNNGSWADEIYLGSAPAIAGQLSWQVCPDADGTDYTVYAELESCGPEITDSSDTSFTIMWPDSAPTIAFGSPVAGTIWQASTTQAIAWTTTLAEGYVELYLIVDSNGLYWIDSAPVEQGSVSWTIPPCIGDATDYSVLLSAWPECGSSLEKTSEPFTITGSLPPPTLDLETPKGGEIWHAGTEHLITWESSNPYGEVWAYLLKGDEWGDTLGSAPMEAGQLSIEICPYVGDGSDYSIEITACACASCVSDKSDAPILITGSSSPPSIDLTEPIGGEVWEAGEPHAITWLAANPSGMVDAYLIESQSGWWDWIGRVPMSDGQIVWDCEFTRAEKGVDYWVFLEWCGCAGCVSAESETAIEIIGLQPWPEIGQLDKDGFMNLSDHKLLLQCLAGPASQDSGVNLSECWCSLFDLDWTRGVDLSDFAILQRNFVEGN